jgi:hypothetical protein
MPDELVAASVTIFNMAVDKAELVHIGDDEVVRFHWVTGGTVDIPAMAVHTAAEVVLRAAGTVPVYLPRYHP